MGTVVMVIWVYAWGTMRHGGPTVIDGFSDYKACSAAVEKVVQGYKQMNDDFEVKAKCITIQK